MLPVAIVVLLGGAGAALALEAADRTNTAYARYLDRAAVGDVEINPSLGSVEIDHVIRRLPGVRAATTSVLFWASIGEPGEPVRYSELSGQEGFEGVFGSTDGRYVTMDRLAYRDGRAPTGRGEVVISRELADDRELGVGERLTLSFWNVYDDLRALFLGEDPLVEPLGVEELTIVGVATFPNEVLPDSLYPRGRMVVSPDVTDRYDCWLHEPASDATIEDALGMLDGCSVSYRYWSLDLEDPERGAALAQDEFIRASGERNARLPTSMVEADARYILISSTTAAEAERVARSVDPTVTGLRVLAVTTALGTIVVGGLVLARAFRRYSDDQLQWWLLGVGVADRTRVVVLPLIASVVAGSVGAVALAWSVSPWGAVGSVRAIEPAPDRVLGVRAVLLVAVIVVLLSGIAAVQGWRSARTVDRENEIRRRKAIGVGLSGSVSPPVAVGLRAAWGTGRGAEIFLAASSIAHATLIAALIFAANLTKLLDTPRSFGWPWDGVVLEGFGYGGVGPDAVSEVLHGYDDVTAWSGLGFWQGITVNGIAVPSLVAYGGDSEVDLAVVGGRLPVARDEVALGSRFALESGIEVGDQVSLAGDGLVTDAAEVTGLVVLPAVGPLQSDRSSPGYGMLVPEAMLEPQLAEGLLSHIGVSLRDGADSRAVLDSVTDDLRRVDPNSVTLTYAEPVLPPEIVETRAVRTVPLAVAGIVAVAAFVALVTAMVASVRARRQEIAVLRALGFTSSQTRRSIRVQSLAVEAASLVIGVPAGIIAGRYAWRTFATELGVVPTPSVPSGGLLAIVVGALLAAGLASALPERLAVRLPLTDGLRTE